MIESECLEDITCNSIIKALISVSSLSMLFIRCVYMLSSLRDVVQGMSCIYVCMYASMLSTSFMILLVQFFDTLLELFLTCLLRQLISDDRSLLAGGSVSELRRILESCAHVRGEKTYWVGLVGHGVDVLVGRLGLVLSLLSVGSLEA